MKTEFATQPVGVDQPPKRSAAKIFVWSVWIVYAGYLLLSDFPPGPSLLHTQPETLQTALDLSLNFGFVMPLLFPAIAPVLNPALEGLFHLVIAWGLLFWGFMVDGRNQRFPILPFLLGTAFLTNVFYLPWLGLRRSNPEPPTTPLNRLEKLGESRFLPIAVVGLAGVALLWAMVARPEWGSLSDRWESLLTLIRSDRLTYSFVVDLGVFWLFQGWLVTDDIVRRKCQNPQLLWLARLLPFFGLAIYLFKRPKLNNPQ